MVLGFTIKKNIDQWGKKILYLNRCRWSIGDFWDTIMYKNKSKRNAVHVFLRKGDGFGVWDIPGADQ